MNILLTLTIIISSLVVVVSGAAAQELQPGDACTASETAQLILSGGPEIPGGHFLVCDGANWISVLDYADSGRSLRQVDNDAEACIALKQGRLRYVSVGDSWDYCNGTSWTAFGSGGGGLWTNSGAGYIEYNNTLGGVRLATVISVAGPAVIGTTNLNDLGDVNATAPAAQQVLLWDSVQWAPGVARLESFTVLSDTPGTYAGNANQSVAVNAGATGLVFVAPPPSIVGGSPGHIQFNNGGAFGGSANLFWDITNSRLGLGTAIPASAIDVSGIVYLADRLKLGPVTGLPPPVMP